MTESEYVVMTVTNQNKSYIKKWLTETCHISSRTLTDACLIVNSWFHHKCQGACFWLCSSHMFVLWHAVSCG